MAKGPNLEIPAELRAVAEKSVEQARKAVDGMMTAAHKALGDSEQRLDVAQENARQLGRRTIGFAEANMAAGFEFAARLAKARTVEEWVTLHSNFAMEQAKRFSEQVKAFGGPGTTPRG